jgi:hypothetical protein
MADDKPEDKTTPDPAKTDPAKDERKKTTPDEGKTFDKDTLFVCARDCFINGVRYRPGDELAGKKCPPFFRVKPAAIDKAKRTPK